MEIDLIRIFEITIWMVVLIGYPLVLWVSQPVSANLKRIEKKITKACEEEGFECTKHDGDLYIKRRGANYRIVLNSMEGTKSAKICFQYVLVLSEPEPVHWAGQLIIENMLSRNYPIINLYVDTKAHSVFANYWADIHSADDFKAHFSFICDKVHEIQNDISELMPKICRDFSDDNSKEKTPIGFR